MSSDLLLKLTDLIRTNPNLQVKFIGPSEHTDLHGVIEYNTPDVLLDLVDVGIKWFYDNRSTHTLIEEDGTLYTSCEGGFLFDNTKEDVIDEMGFDEEDERIEEIERVILVTLKTNI